MSTLIFIFRFFLPLHFFNLFFFTIMMTIFFALHLLLRGKMTSFCSFGLILREKLDICGRDDLFFFALHLILRGKLEFRETDDLLLLLT